MNKRRAIGVRQAAVLLVVALVVALVFAGQPLRESAERVSSPAFRAVAVGLTKPFAAIGALLHLGAGRQWMLGGFGGNDDGGTTALAGPARALHGAAGSPPRPNPAFGLGASVANGSSTSTTLESRFDSTNPLRVLVVGDSLVGEIARSLVRVAERQPLKVQYQFKVSSGLALPRFYDWPAQMWKLVPAFKPDVTVLMFGNNDHHSLPGQGKALSIFSAEWKAEYRKRVEQVAGIAAEAGSAVIWVGMPIMRDDDLSAQARTLDAIYSGVCVDKGYWYIDTYALFSDKAGNYAPYLPDASSKVRLMRAADGVHLTPSGGNRVVAEITKILDKHYILEPRPAQ